VWVEWRKFKGTLEEEEGKIKKKKKRERKRVRERTEGGLEQRGTAPFKSGLEVGC